MAHSYRSLIVQNSTGSFKGLLTVMRLVNYLGGGDLFQIVERRHNFNLFSALSKEPVESIMEKNPVVVYVDEGIKEALARMVNYGAGILPVLNRENRVVGILTEHDLVKYLAGVVSLGLKVGDVMSSPVVTVGENATFKRSNGEQWLKYGFRRLASSETMRASLRG